MFAREMDETLHACDYLFFYPAARHMPLELSSQPASDYKLITPA